MNELPNIRDRADVLDLFHVTKYGPAAIEIAPKKKSKTVLSAKNITRAISIRNQKAQERRSREHVIQEEVLYNKDDIVTTEQVDANDEYNDEEAVNVIASDREDIPDDADIEAQADVPHHQPFDSENTKYEVALISLICEAPEYRKKRYLGIMSARWH